MFKQSENDSGWCRLILHEGGEDKVGFFHVGDSTNEGEPPLMSVEEYLEKFPKQIIKEEENQDKDKKGGPYINYSNAPNSWKLSNGLKPPAEKYFENPEYDETSRTFKGSIDWAPNTFGGDSKWDYTMTFSEDFKIIESG